MKRLGRPEEVASVVGFLLDGTKSGFVTVSLRDFVRLALTKRRN